MALNRDKVLREAEKLVQKGKVDQAIREYEKILKSNPNDANTINRVGDLYGRVGQVDKAIELYERIASYFTQDGFTTKAIAMLKKINRLAPQRLDIFDRLAELYIQQGLKVEAKNQYQMLADWYARNGENDDAVRIHRKLVELEPSNHMAHLRLADALMQGNQQDESLAVYDRLGRMLLERDKLDEAERLYRHVLEQEPPRGDFLVPFCNALLNVNRTAVAREFVDAGVRLSPDNRELQALKVQVQLATGDSSEALAAAKRMAAAEPENRKKKLLLARSLLAVGDAAQARGLLLEVLDGALDRGDGEEAHEVAHMLVEALPRDTEVLERAVEALAGGDAADLVTAKRALADAYFVQGQAEQARRAYDELTRLAPDDETVHSRLAQLGGPLAPAASRPAPAAAAPAPSRAGEEAGATKRDVAAEPIGPESQTVSPQYQPEERLAEASVFAKYGLVDKAINHLKEIIEQAPQLWEAREKLVVLFVEQGRLDEAREVAAPLANHYEESANVSGLASLRKALGEAEELPPHVAAAPPHRAAERPAAPMAEHPPAEEEIVVVDIEDELLEEAEPEIAAAIEVEPEVAAEPEVEFEVAAGEPELAAAAPPVEEPEFAPGEAEVASPPAEEELLEFRVEGPAAAPDEAPAGGAEELPELTFEPAPPAAAWSSESSGTRHSLRDLDELEASLRPVRAPRRKEPEPLPAAEALEPETVEPSAAESLGEFGVVQFEAEPSAPPAAAAQPAEPAAEEPPAFVAELGRDEEELVEITPTVTGAPLEDLEQIDFFITQELYEDAVRLLTRLEDEYPDDPDVADRRLVLKSKGVVLEQLAAAEGEEPEELFAEEEEYIDLAKELEAELAEEEAMVDEATGRGKDEALLEEVFREFQKGVSEQLSEEDSDTHFNLGIAYKEMGLLPEAIGEFQISSRDPGYFLESCSMIGMCYLEQGLPEQGAEWYRRALEAPDLTDDGRTALRYDLAVALEFAGDVDQAAALFGDIVVETPGYRDVEARLTELQRQRSIN